MKVRFLSAGDTAIVVDFGDRIDRELNDHVLELSEQVRAAKLSGVVETMPTFRSLMVYYDPMVTGYATLVREIENLLGSPAKKSEGARLWRIPACYASSHAPDLAEVAQRTGLDEQEVIDLHSGTHFHIYMLGFVPGFGYMGDLPQALVLPRRADPRPRVPPGSVAIATNLTTIYPLEGPGGWHLIGTTPIRLFDLRWDRPALFASGDSVKFDPVSVAEFEAIRAAVAADNYHVPCAEMTI